MNETTSCEIMLPRIEDVGQYSTDHVLATLFVV